MNKVIVNHDATKFFPVDTKDFKVCPLCGQIPKIVWVDSEDFHSTCFTAGLKDARHIFYVPRSLIEDCVSDFWLCFSRDFLEPAKNQCNSVGDAFEGIPFTYDFGD